MFNYIWREFVNALKSKSARIYVIATLALCIIANAAVVAFRLIYGTNEGTFAYNLLVYATWCFVLPYYSCIYIADIVFGKEYPNPMIKDNYTKDMSRTQIYFGKLISSIMLALVFVVIAVICLFATTLLFQIKDGGLAAYEVKDFLRKMVIAIPLWIAGVAFGNMFLFVCDKKKFAYIWFFVLTLLLPRTIMQLAAEPLKLAPFRFLRTYTITQNFSLIPYPADPARNIPLTIALGIIYAVIASVIGCVCYNRKKFK